MAGSRGDAPRDTEVGLEPGTSPGAGACPRLERSVTTLNGASLVRLRGVIDGTVGRKDIIGNDVVTPLVVDMDGVHRMTSFGVREWIQAIAPFARGKIYLARVRPSIVAQMNVISNFCGNAEVLSIYLPYLCDTCGNEHDVLVDLRSERALLSADAVPVRGCRQCDKQAEFDDVPESFFSYVARQPEPIAPPAILALLEDSAPKKARLKVQKEISEDVTALWLSGPLDERARFKRTVDGVEGSLVLICGGITEINDAGIDQLAQLSRLKGVAVYFARVREELATALVNRHVAPRILSLVARGSCDTCGGSDVVVDEGVLRGRHAATCLSCGAPAEAGSPISRQFDMTPPNVAGYLASRPGAFLPDLDDGELSANTPSEQGTPMSRYRVLGRIGAGGMAEVLLAEQLGPAGFHKQVVLKRILQEHAHREDFVEMFLNEARTAAFIQHPHVAQIYDLGRDGPHYFIAMEYVRGIDLRGVLKIVRRLQLKMPVPIAARIAADMCAGLHGAHTTVDNAGKPLGIVHQDVSPTNVLLSNHGVVKIVDFGVARTNAQRHQAGLLKGKAIYMAPEQIDEERGPIDARADIFACGLVFHQMLTGTPAFLRPTEEESLFAILHQRVADVRVARPDTPTKLAMIVAKACSPSRDERFASAEEMQLAIERFLTRDNQSTTAAHVGQWLSWVRGIHDQTPAQQEPSVVDIEELSSAATRP